MANLARPLVHTPMCIWQNVYDSTALCLCGIDIPGHLGVADFITACNCCQHRVSGSVFPIVMLAGNILVDKLWLQGIQAPCLQTVCIAKSLA